MPEIPPIFINSFTQEKLSFAVPIIFLFSLASSIRDIMSITILTIMFEYPIPFTPRFKDEGRFDTRNVSHNKLNISLAIVNK